MLPANEASRHRFLAATAREKECAVSIGNRSHAILSLIAEDKNLRHFIRNILLSLVAVCAATAYSQSAARVNLPFDFTVTKEHFLAGDYNIVMDENRGFILLANEKNLSKRIRLIVEAGETNAPTTLLRFDVCGEEHVLRNIQMGTRLTANLDTSRNQTGGIPCVMLKY
jgi:hypothetical protein